MTKLCCQEPSCVMLWYSTQRGKSLYSDTAEDALPRVTDILLVYKEKFQQWNALNNTDPCASWSKILGTGKVLKHFLCSYWRLLFFPHERNCQLFPDLETGHYLLCCWVTCFSSSLYVVSLDQKPLQEETISWLYLYSACHVGVFLCLSPGRTGPLYFRRDGKGKKPALLGVYQYLLYKMLIFSLT